MKTAPLKKTAGAESVAVIVLNHNKRDELLKCLRSVQKITNMAYEVVVVDNGSTDGSGQAASEAYRGIHLVQSTENLGASGGRNLGFEYVQQNINCRYVLFLDNDAVVEEQCIEELVTALSIVTLPRRGSRVQIPFPAPSYNSVQAYLLSDLN